MNRISVITPCYNGASYLNRFFRSILDQTYQGEIELVFVDDGSTDETADIAASYEEALARRGILYRYIRQENAGQAAALNRGLAVFTGDYFVWTDADDLLHPENLEKKAAFLDAHPECGFVMCRGQEVADARPEVKLRDLMRVPPAGRDTLFEDLVTEKNVVFPPGVYMVRREAFFKAIPSGRIMTSRLGQNWQMLLPLAYHCRCGYIRDCLFSYCIRENSHSREVKQVNEVYARYEAQRGLLQSVLQNVQPENMLYYLRLAEEQCLRKKLDYAYRIRDRKKLDEVLRAMRSAGCATGRDRLICAAGRNPAVNLLYKGYQKIKANRRAKKMSLLPLQLV